MGNREQWLNDLAKQVEPIFRGYKLDPYRLTCGWPCRRGLSNKQRVIGECHALESSAGGVHEIFISPTLDKPLEVAGVVCHEIAHVAAGIKAAHKGRFIQVCKHIGLTKNKPTSAAPGTELEERLQKILDRQGEYPHKALIPMAKVIIKPKSQFTLVCRECGCKVSISAKWLDEVGAPTCGCNGLMEVQLDAPNPS
jgi:hypothetical protein